MAMLGQMSKLSILIPVYNESRTIVSVMNVLTEVFPDAELIYINDGSKDDSLELIKKYARPQDKVLTKENGGKGSAIRMGLTEVTGDYVAIQDADLEYDPKEIQTLLSFAELHQGTIVFGSRFLTKNPNLYRLYLLGNKTLTSIVNILFFARLSDSYTCYKLFPTEILKKLPLKARGFELEAELTAYPLKMGYKIVEVPITYHPRTFEEGKKINWKDAVKGIWTMVKIRSTKL